MVTYYTRPIILFTQVILILCADCCWFPKIRFTSGFVVFEEIKLIPVMT